MMGDDGAGPLLAQMCAAHPQGEWVVIDGGSAPENDVVAIRELRPDRLLIVDATDMGLNPGETRLIDPDDIAEMFMMTTHNMPLNYLVDQIKDDVGEVLFLGIQLGHRWVLLSDDAAGERGRRRGLFPACRMAWGRRFFPTMSSAGWW
jgi:hydrogenase 3 maturation protease